jgi:hypothetical protein
LESDLKPVSMRFSWDGNASDNVGG